MLWPLLTTYTRFNLQHKEMQCLFHLMLDKPLNRTDAICQQPRGHCAKQQTPYCPKVNVPSSNC